jgi:hypothetical protein
MACMLGFSVHCAACTQHIYVHIYAAALCCVLPALFLALLVVFCLQLQNLGYAVVWLGQSQQQRVASAQLPRL